MNPRAPFLACALLLAGGAFADGPRSASGAVFGNPARAAFLRQQSDRQMLARDLFDKQVVNPHAEHLGRVHDLIVDRQGSVIGIVVSMGGFLGLGDKLVALPWRDVTVRNDGKFVVVNLSGDQLDRAPEYRSREMLRRERSTIHVAEPQREGPDATRP